MLIRYLVALSAALLAGCASPNLYDWNRYDQSLYDYYKDPSTETAFRTKLEAHLSAQRESGKKPAPGLLAELGTLYLKSGDTKSATRYYQLEAETWPESRPLMEILIVNIDKPTTGDKK